MTISIVQCIGCGADILVWDAAPDALCFRCEQQETSHGGLGRWIGDFT